jgi:hypothetical protein
VASSPRRQKRFNLVPLVVWTSVFYVALVLLALRPRLKEGATLLALPIVIVPLVLFAWRVRAARPSPKSDSAEEENLIP